MRRVAALVLVAALTACSGAVSEAPQPGEQTIRKLPHRLLPKLEWWFLKEAPDKKSAFDDIVASLQRDASVWDPNYVILERSSVAVRFAAAKKAMPDREVVVTLQAGGDAFTALDFLFTLHSAVVANLEKGDKQRRLASLVIEEPDADPVVYRLKLGGGE